MIEDAFQQLLQNSIDAMPQGGELSISVEFDNTRDVISVRIADSGPVSPKRI